MTTPTTTSTTQPLAPSMGAPTTAPTTATPVENTAPLPTFTPPVDIHESKDEYIIVADLPGVPKENLRLHLEKRELTIEGRTAEPVSGGRALLREFRSGQYNRVFRLPQGIDENGVSAMLQAGVLTVRVPKSEAMKPREIPVRVS